MYRQAYESWLHRVKDEAVLSELLSIRHDDAQIRDRFMEDLPFGTAGLRGVMGAGLARMNLYTVGKATQGLADYIRAHGNPQAGMVIAYDTRHFSREFAVRAAEVLAGNGIPVHIFGEPTSVPELSFAVRRLQAFGGIVITASHNPKEYSGYKVYAAYGGQLGPEESRLVTEHIRRVDLFQGVRAEDFEQARKSGAVRIVGPEMDDAYCERMVALCGDERKCDGFKVAYTPLHGTGARTAVKAFGAAGFDLRVVEEQAVQDGDFPTVVSPNPEDRRALDRVIALAQKEGAALAAGTDPDADRMGAAVRDGSGEYVMLTGNQIGCLLAVYLLEMRRQKGVTRPGYIVKSFVSTRMADAIAAQYGVACHTVLTGFRYISELITRNEGSGSEFVFGFEESYGYLAGDYTRDKDGVMAALILAQAACHYARQGKTLTGVLRSLYDTFGYYREKVLNLRIEGLDGMQRMRAAMDALRESDIRGIGGKAVTSAQDYLSGVEKTADGARTPLALPKTDALLYNMENGAWICVRPSGTEPKLKVYLNAREDTPGAADESIGDMEKAVAQMLRIS